MHGPISHLCVRHRRTVRSSGSRDARASFVHKTIGQRGPSRTMQDRPPRIDHLSRAVADRFTGSRRRKHSGAARCSACDATTSPTRRQAGQRGAGCHPTSHGTRRGSDRSGTRRARSMVRAQEDRRQRRPGHLQELVVRHVAVQQLLTPVIVADRPPQLRARLVINAVPATHARDAARGRSEACSVRSRSRRDNVGPRCCRAWRPD